MDTDKIVAATAAIRQAAQKYAVEPADPDARAEIEKEIDILRGNCPGDCGKTILSLSSWLDILYSARRRERYRNPASNETGAEVVRADVCRCLDSIERRVKGF